LSDQTVDSSLIPKFEGLRTREQMLIHDLLEILPKIDNLADDRIGQVRDALFHADHPFLMVFVGPFSSGKTSLINALLGDSDLLAVGPVPTTDHISILRWGEESQRMRSGDDVESVFYDSPLLKKVSFVDTPGLESVFQTHEETTRRFLHRSDVVLLVMLATQAMTARNHEYLQMLQDFGKKVLIVVNQVDLLTAEEAETVRDYVLDQGRDVLGTKPEVWMVSAKEGLDARKDGTVNAVLWESSGMQQIERYIDRQLGDTERLRQKLQTPLQIVQNVNQTALTAVRDNQSVLDQYQSITENIEGQLAAQKRDLEKVIRAVTSEIGEQFDEASKRSGAAIRDLFRFSRAVGSIWRGVLELIGLSRLFRPAGRRSYIKEAFESGKAFEPVDALPGVVDKLAPRLEGKDMQDIDDLVKYGQRETQSLPESMREKVIGSIQAPVQYDRQVLQAVRTELEMIEDEARVVETDNLEQTLRSALLYLAGWEVLMVVLGVALINAWGAIGADQPQLPFVLLVIVLALILLGLLVMPLAGRWVATSFANRMLKLRSRYIDAVSGAADAQVDYGMRLRRDTMLPLTRLIEAQTEIHNSQLKRLQETQHEIWQETLVWTARVM
jgi:ribosome biogenesis GTPase A